MIGGETQATSLVNIVMLSLPKSRYVSYDARLHHQTTAKADELDLHKKVGGNKVINPTEPLIALFVKISINKRVRFKSKE
jgi:hypothetical protein